MNHNVLDIKNFEDTVFKKCEEFIVAWQKKNPNKTFRFGVTGGSTVGSIYTLLSASELIDWDRILIILTDERWVSIDSKASNMRMLSDTLLLPGKVDLDNVVFFCTEENCEKEDSLRVVEDMVKDLLKERTPLFDLLTLGVGPDGHVASVFPGSVGETADSFVCATESDKFEVRNRVTFTAKGLSSASEVWFILKGTRKRPVFDLIKEKGTLPVHKLQDKVPNCKVWFGI